MASDEVIDLRRMVGSFPSRFYGMNSRAPNSSCLAEFIPLPTDFRNSRNDRVALQSASFDAAEKFTLYPSCRYILHTHAGVEWQTILFRAYFAFFILQSFPVPLLTTIFRTQIFPKQRRSRRRLHRSRPYRRCDFRRLTY